MTGKEPSFDLMGAEEPERVSVASKNCPHPYHLQSQKLVCSQCSWNLTPLFFAQPHYSTSCTINVSEFSLSGSIFEGENPQTPPGHSLLSLTNLPLVPIVFGSVSGHRCCSHMVFWCPVQRVNQRGDDHERLSLKPVKPG